MKIAVVTDGGTRISRHFGRAEYYLVFNVEDNQVIGSEQREKANHRHFAPHEHEHNHGHEHGSGPDSDAKHGRMIESIRDCAVVIVGGMGRGAYTAMQQVGIRPIVTDLSDAEQAVRDYLRGALVDHVERLH